MIRTPIAADFVRRRNAVSPRRRRPSTLARDAASDTTAASPRRATSTTGGLPAGSITDSLGRFFREPTQAAKRPRHKASFSVKTGRVEKAPGSAFSSERQSMRGREEWLAGSVLDLRRPDLLDGADDIVRHRHEVELFGHLIALGKAPSEELERFGCGGRILRLLVGQDEGRAPDPPHTP